MQNHTDKEPIDAPQTTTEDKEENIISLSGNLTKYFTTVAHEMLDSHTEKTVIGMLGNKIIDVNTKGKDGNTALHHAISDNDEEDVRVLLNQFRADVNIKNKIGDTPLHLAANEQNLAITKLLLDTKKPPEERGDVHAQNKEGDTPFHIAARNSNKEICDHLQIMGANWNIRNLANKTVLDVAEDPEFKKHLSDEISRKQRKSDIICGFMIAIVPAIGLFLGTSYALMASGVKSVEAMVITPIAIALAILGAGAMIGACNPRTPPTMKLDDASAEQTMNSDIGQSK